MSDYTPITDFSVKDGLTANDPEKVISGADVDGEFDAIQTAINSKYDSTDISTEVEAEAGTLDTKIITPLQLKNVLQDNGGIAYDLQQLAAPGADQVLCYDFGTTSAKGFTLGDGLEFSGDTIRLEHLGLGDLEDAGADRLLFWDDGAGFLQWMAPTNGLSISGTSLVLTDYAPTTGRPIGWTSGVPDLDITALANTTIAALAANTFEFVIDDGGTPKAISLQDFGMWVQQGAATQTLALTDANSVMEMNGGVTITIPTNASVPFVLGTCIVFVNDHASSNCTIDAAAGVTLNSIYHPGGTDSASDSITAGGMAVLIKTGTDEWSLSGDTIT
jgi:hypothetical protein